MKIKRIVPDIRSKNLEGNQAFYGDFLGLDLVMDQGWVMTFASPANPSAQVTVARPDSDESLLPDVSIEVENVRKSYEEAESLGLPIVYPLTVEPWGVTRYFLRDPNGKIVNILSHSKMDSGQEPEGKTPNA